MFAGVGIRYDRGAAPLRARCAKDLDRRWSEASTSRGAPIGSDSEQRSSPSNSRGNGGPWPTGISAIGTRRDCTKPSAPSGRASSSRPGPSKGTELRRWRPQPTRTTTTPRFFSKYESKGWTHRAPPLSLAPVAQALVGFVLGHSRAAAAAGRDDAEAILLPIDVVSLPTADRLISQ